MHEIKDIDETVAKVVYLGWDSSASPDNKKILEYSLDWANRSHDRNENMSDEDWKNDVKKAYKCISFRKDKDDFICVLVGHGVKGQKEEAYDYYWFLWYKKDGEYEYYNYTNKETVDKIVTKLQQETKQRDDEWISAFKDTLNAMLNGSVCVEKHPKLIEESKGFAEKSRQKLFTCLEHNGNVFIALQFDEHDEDFDDIRYEWYAWYNVGTKDQKSFQCDARSLSGTIIHAHSILEDQSKIN